MNGENGRHCANRAAPYKDVNMDSLPETPPMDKPDLEQQSPVAALAAIEAFAMFLVNVKRLAAGQQPITDFHQLNAHSQAESFFAAKQRIACWRMAERMYERYMCVQFGEDYALLQFDLLPVLIQAGWFRAAEVADAVHHATMTGDDPVRTSEIVLMQGRETRTAGVR